MLILGGTGVAVLLLFRIAISCPRVWKSMGKWDYVIKTAWKGPIAPRKKIMGCGILKFFGGWWVVNACAE